MKKKPTYEELEQRVRELETTLLEQQNLKGLLDRAPNAVFLIDLSGNILQANEMGAKRLGKKPEEILGTTLRDYFPPHISRERRLKGIEALKTGKMQRIEDRVDGKYYLSTILPVKNENTHEQRLAIFSTDITEQKRTENELRRNERYLSRVIQTALDGFWVLDRRGLVVDVNDAYCKMSGYTRDEIIGMAITDLDALESPSETAERIKAVMSKGFDAFKTEHRRKNGSIWPVEISTTYLKENNGCFVCFCRDMTERKRAATYLNLAGVMFISLDLDGKVTTTNRHACKVLECSESDIVGRDWFKTFLPQNIRRQTRDIFMKLVSGQINQMEYLENPVITKGGKEKVIAWHNTYLKDPDGGITGVLSAGEDITEKRFLEEKYKSIVRTAMDGFVRTDSLGGILEVNPAYCQMTGFTETELLQMSIADLDYLQNRKMVEAQIQKIIHAGQDRFQSQHRRKDGTIIDVEIVVQHRREDNGQFVSFIRDITKQKMQEKELSFQAMLLDQIQDLVTATDLDGKIIYVNDAVCRNIKKKRDEILGLSVESFGENPEKGVTQRQIMEGTRAHGEWRGEVVNYAADGTELIIDCRTKLIRDELGSPVSMIGISTDITEQKKMAEFVQQAQKMESIGNLAGGIAHDFNNILFPILGMSELLLEDIPSDSLEHEKIEHIHKAAERGGKLVEQILAFSRLSEHKMIPLGIQRVLKEALALIRSSIPTNIEISQNISNDCGLINGDPSQIHQVVMNLVTNAYHAVEESGGGIAVNLREIDSELENLSLLSLEPGKYANLSILDTGCGIDPDHLERIFEPYFTTKPQGKGTGFGLAVAYGIIKEHGGDIRVQSEPGKGSVFDVYLPLLEKVGETETAVKKRNHPSGTERILIVDDESDVIQIEKQLLERLGYTVTGSTDSDAALAAFCEGPDRFDLVITDMAMPKMTGLEFAEKLVHIRADIPVILCTGFSERVGKKTIRRPPIKALLKKPVSINRLAHTVRGVLDGNREVDL